MERVEHAIQDKYPEDFAWCYGCGYLNKRGLHFRTGWDGEHTVTIYTPQPEHLAIPGFVYGGFIASLVDCHGTGSAAIALHHKNGHNIEDDVHPPRFVTASLHVDYKRPTPQGVTLKAVGTVEEIHPKKFKVETEVFAGEDLVATGEVVAVVKPDSFR